MLETVALFRGRQKGELSPAEQALPAQALARVLELVQQVGEVQRPEDVLGTALDAAIDLTEAERGWILIQRPDAGLEVAVARHRGGRALEDPLSKVSRTVVEQALLEQQPLCVDEAREDATLGAAQSVNEMRLRAVLCAPFHLSEAVGVFYLDNRFAAGVFNQQALQLLGAFAGPVAMILRHADLEKRLEDTADALASANHELDQRLRDQTAEVVRLEGMANTQAHEARQDPFREILGSSPAMQHALKALGQAAEGRYPVLLRGESGTGKDLAARALHRASGRSEAPFVAVAIAGITGSLIEAELFGVRKGAYTGADEDRQGLIEAAGEGTLYLDGIDAMPLELQPKLLRVLEDGSFQRVGGGERQCRARIVVATRLDLADAVRAGCFREDLYYRVRVVEIVLPAIRERRGDLRLLLEHFVRIESERNGLPVEAPQGEQLERLLQHHWPGNVRELANFATRWVAYQGALPDSEWEHVLVSREQAPGTLQEMADQALLQALEEAGGNKTEAARRLGISRRTLYNRLKALGRD